MNGFDFDGNRHGEWVERNPDGSLKRKGRYVHGTFYTGNSYEKKKDPVRHEILRAFGVLKGLPLESKQTQKQYRQVQKSMALLYQSIKQNQR